MSFSDRRKGGSEGRGMEGNYIPWGVTGAEILWSDTVTNQCWYWLELIFCQPPTDFWKTKEHANIVEVKTFLCQTFSTNSCNKFRAQQDVFVELFLQTS